MLFEGKIVFYLKKLYISSHVLENREFFFGELLGTLEFWLSGNTSTVSFPFFFFFFIFFNFLSFSRQPNIPW